MRLSERKRCFKFKCMIYIDYVMLIKEYSITKSPMISKHKGNIIMCWLLDNLSVELWLFPLKNDVLKF